MAATVAATVVAMTTSSLPAQKAQRARRAAANLLHGSCCREWRRAGCRGLAAAKAALVVCCLSAALFVDSLLFAVRCALFLPKMQLHTKFRTAREIVGAEAARRRLRPPAARLRNRWVAQTALVRAHSHTCARTVLFACCGAEQRAEAATLACSCLQLLHCLCLLRYCACKLQVLHVSLHSECNETK